MPDSAPVSLLPFRQRAPFAGLFLAAVLGILMSDQQPQWWPYWSAGFLVAALVVLKFHATWPACLLIFFLLAFWHGNKVTTDPGYQRSLQNPFDANEHTVTLLILSEPKLDQLRSIQQFVALVSCIDGRPARFKVSAECGGEAFSYGDQIICQGMFHLPTHPLDPGEFDFAAHLQRQNIYLKFRTHRDVPAMVIAQNQGNPFVAGALAARHRILQALQEGLQDDAEVAQTIQGMILGARAETGPALKKLFRDTGTIHLFAASGLQVSLVTGLAWTCLRYIGSPRQSMALTIVPIAIAYCAVTGFYPATVRATAMAIFIAGGVSLERPVATVNSLCGSGLLILLHDTQELFQTGFQLSFAAVFAILTLVRPLAHLLYRPFQIDPFLPLQLLRPWQHCWHNGLLRSCEIASLSIVCWCATAPVLILQEHHISSVAIFANLLVVPLATCVMVLGVTSVIAGSISRGVALCFNNTNWLMTKVILLILHAASLVPWHSVNVAPSALVQPDRVTGLSEGADHVFHLHVKSHDWLVNTGKLSAWRRITEPYLESQGVNCLDKLILCDAAAHEAEVVQQMNEGFNVLVIYPPFQWENEAKPPRCADELVTPLKDADTAKNLVEILTTSEARPRETASELRAIEAILVHLGEFRVLILPDVTEAGLAALKCDHADVVYCGRLQSRRFPRELMIAKLSPSILILSGIKPEVAANTRQPTPKCFYTRQDGAVTTALVNGELLIRSYRGSESRLRSRSR